ncbi:MAG: metallophosphoesterase [Pseudomonadota bacterium]
MGTRSGPPVTKFLAITDIHMKPPGGTIIGIDPAARLERALDHALTRHPDAARLILMGDQAHSGRAMEYARIAPLLRACPVPVTVIPGNHDRRDVMVRELGLTPPEDGFLHSVWDTPSHRVICLDTLFGPPFLDYAHFGTLCPARLAWLDRQLNQAPAPAVIVAHHPPMETGLTGMDQIRLREADALAEVLSGRAVAHMFFGHIHRTISGSWQGIGYTIFKSPCHQAPLALGVGDLSLSTDEPGAYGVVLLGAHGVTSHSEDFDLATAPFTSSADALPES